MDKCIQRGFELARVLVRAYQVIVRTISASARSWTRGIVTSPVASTTVLPDLSLDVVHETSLPGHGLNCWQRRGVTATVIAPLVSSFHRRTD